MEGFNGLMLNPTTFSDYTKNCCAGCNDPTDWSEAESLLWFDTFSFFCSFCATQEGYQDYLERM